MGATGERINEPAGDFRRIRISRQTDLAGHRGGHGLNVKMKLKSLRGAALDKALADTNSSSLVWIYYFINGYRPVSANAYYSKAQGFTFGFNHYVTGRSVCGSPEKCVIFPGRHPLHGKVNRKRGTITLSVPRRYLRKLVGSQGPHERPDQVRVRKRAKFYDGTAFSFGNAQPDQKTDSYLYPLDNSPAMDFRLPH